MSRKSQRAPLNIRFGRYVYLSEDSDCWEWRGTKNDAGYGFISDEGGRSTGNIRAHRLSYQIFYNTKLKSEEFVCHSCDNPSCVNPDHLFVGSHMDNMMDMISKGRLKTPPVRRGESSNLAKLKEREIHRIRHLYANGLSSTQVGQIFSVSRHTILAIINRKTWKHV